MCMLSQKAMISLLVYRDSKQKRVRADFLFYEGHLEKLHKAGWKGRHRRKSCSAVAIAGASEVKDRRWLADTDLTARKSSLQGLCLQHTQACFP